MKKRCNCVACETRREEDALEDARKSSFENNKFYVGSPPMILFSDFDGPFNSLREAKDFLLLIENPSAEMMNMVVCHFENNVMNFVRDENTKAILNLSYIRDNDF